MLTAWSIFSFHVYGSDGWIPAFYVYQTPVKPCENKKSHRLSACGTKSFWSCGTTHLDENISPSQPVPSYGALFNEWASRRTFPSAHHMICKIHVRLRPIHTDIRSALHQPAALLAVISELLFRNQWFICLYSIDRSLIPPGKVVNIFFPGSHDRLLLFTAFQAANVTGFAN